MTASSPLKIMQDGSRVLWREAGGVSFLLADSPRPSEFRMHQHEATLVSFLIAGAICEIDDQKRKTERGPQSVHLSPPDVMHGHWIETPRLTTLCFDLKPPVLAGVGDSMGVFSAPSVIRSGPVINFLPRLHREMLASDTASSLVLTGLVYELVGELLRRRNGKPPSDPPAWLRRARELLRDRIGENVSVTEVAQLVGVHPSHLTRTFRTYTNESPGEYVRRIRLERATREVLMTDKPLKQIAELAGFADQAHFSREFRRMHGASPMRFRQDMRL